MKIIRFIGLISSLVLLCTLLATGPLMAQEEKPFADQKFVLQISDMDPAKQTLVLNVAGNILKARIKRVRSPGAGPKVIWTNTTTCL